MSRQDPVAKSDAFDATLDQNPVVKNLIRLTQQHNRIIRWLGFAITVAFAAAVVAVLAGLSARSTAGKASDAASAAASAKVQARSVCRAVNQGRHDSLNLWRFVLTLPSPPDETPAARQQRLAATAKFKAYIDKVFAPKDCAHPKSSTASVPSFPAGTHAAGSPTPPAAASAGVRPAPGSSPAPPPRSRPATPPQPTRTSARPTPPPPSPTPHPIRSCLHRPVKCLPISGAAAGPGSGPPTGTMLMTGAALLAGVVTAVWWRYGRVSPRFRSPPGRTLRRSANRQGAR